MKNLTHCLALRTLMTVPLGKNLRDRADVHSLDGVQGAAFLVKSGDHVV